MQGDPCRTWAAQLSPARVQRGEIACTLSNVETFDDRLTGCTPEDIEAISIPAKRVVKFRVAKQAKEAILGSK